MQTASLSRTRLAGTSNKTRFSFLPRSTLNPFSPPSPPPPEIMAHPPATSAFSSAPLARCLCKCLLFNTNVLPQSFSDYGGGAGHNNPGTRSARSTPRGSSGNNGSNGFYNHGHGGAGATPSCVSGAGTASTATPRGGNGGGGGTKGKWESTALRKQRRSSSTSDGGLETGIDEAGGGVKRGPLSEGALWRQQSSSFVRDFIRGAGIHRLDPRRLSGEKTAHIYNQRV